MTCSQHVHDMFMKCSRHVHGMFMPCSQDVYDMITTCSQHAHDMFTACSWHVHDMFMTYVHHISQEKVEQTYCIKNGWIFALIWLAGMLSCEIKCSKHFFDFFFNPCITGHGGGEGGGCAVNT